MRPKSSSSTLICRSSVARIAPSAIGISYAAPVRLSVTERLSAGIGPPLVDLSRGMRPSSDERRLRASRRPRIRASRNYVLPILHSVPIELSQPRVADAEVVGDLMENDAPNLPPKQRGVAPVEALEWTAVDRDLVGRD